MLTANLLLMFLVIILLFKNHFEKDKGILFLVGASFAFYIRLLSESFPVLAFEDYPLVLKFVLSRELIGFLAPPFLILYFTTIFNKSNWPKPIYYLLFVPFLLSSINFIPFWGLSLSDQIQLFKNPNYILSVKSYLLISWPVFDMISDFYNSILGGLAIFFIYRGFTSQKSLIKKRNFNSLVQLWLITGIHFILLIVLFLPKYVGLAELINWDVRGIISLFYPISVLLFPNYLFNNSDKSDLSFYLRLSNHLSKNEFTVDSSDDDIISDSTRILNYLNNERPYLSPGFSKHNIVTKLNIPQKTVTDCFSRIIKVPFPRLRNQLRVEHAIELLKNDVHLTKTISGIAFDSGFKNRSTFYLAFKEVTNMTPVEWIKENCEFELVEESDVASSEGSKSMATQSRV